YLVPPHFQARLHIGSRVLVPLGRMTTQGLVFHLTEKAPPALHERGIARTNLREIASLMDSPEDASLDSTLIR
ncbi:MAG: hypothetical protein GTO40_18510, partial [Deltaproteobacteria bacterium]|nr:hypothetical protein [Deltaproteobacteria bacterium]